MHHVCQAIPACVQVFCDFTPRGKGREFDDLDLVMKKMEHWAHRWQSACNRPIHTNCRLYPKLPFDSVLDVLSNRLGKKKVE